MTKDWTAKDVLEIARASQPTCVLAAGAELGVFDALAGGARGARELAEPLGADPAWVSAIMPMNSRQENRRLFAKVHAALRDGGQILIRDIVMDESRTSPADGAMFAVNMLVNTPGGGTFTFEEPRDDLLAAGFRNPTQLLKGQAMDSVIQAGQ